MRRAAAAPHGHRPVLPLLFLLLAAAGVQTTTLAIDRIPWTSDQALVGLMARHMTNSVENPIFYYGSAYAGTLEPRYIAGVFRLLGSSVLTYRFALILLLALLLCLIYAIGLRAFGSRASLVAVSYLVLPPFFFLYKGLTSDGAYDALALLGAGIVLAAFRLDQAIGAGEPARRWIGLIGLLAGLGWWVDSLIGYFYLAVVLWFLIVRPRVFGRLRDYPPFLFFFALGSLPWWMANIGKGWPSLHVPALVWLSPAETAKQFGRFWTEAVPVLFGARPYTGWEESFAGASWIALLIYAIPVLFACAFLLQQAVGRGKGGLPAVRDLDFRLLLLLLILLGSMQALVSLNPQSYIPEPRYLFPIYIPFSLLVGFTVERTTRRIPWPVILAFGFAVLAFNAYGILRAPRQNDIVAHPTTGQLTPLIHALEERGLYDVYTGYWTGYRLSFESGERIRPTSFGFGSGATDRYPPYAAQVARSQNPAVVLRDQEAQAYAEYLRRWGGNPRRAAVGPYVIFWDLPPGIVEEMQRLREVPGFRPPRAQ